LALIFSYEAINKQFKTNKKDTSLNYSTWQFNWDNLYLTQLPNS